MASPTKTGTPLEPESPPIMTSIWQVAATWLLPGAGYFMLKKSGRGALTFAAVITMFLFGMFMRGVMFTPEKGTDYLTTFINYGGFLCNLASGGIYIFTSMFVTAQVDMAGAVHDYGTKFLVSAGLLNILAMVDVWEISRGEKE